MPDQEDPFKKYGGKQIEDPIDPFKKYGGKAIVVKKKETDLLSGGQAGSFNGLLGGVKKIAQGIERDKGFEGGLPETEADIERRKEQDELYTLRQTPEFTNDPVKEINKYSLGKSVENFNRPKTESVKQKHLSPENEIDEEKISEYSLGQIKKDLEENAFPTAQSAREWIYQNKKGVWDEKNETDKIALKRMGEYQKKADLINEKGLTKETAVQLYAETDPQVRAIVKEGGMPPEETQERLFGQLLNDRDVHELAFSRKGEVPGLNEKYLEEKANFRQRNPLMWTNEIVQKIAQGREDYGENNPFLNLTGVNSSDRVIEQLLHDGKIDKASYQKYYDEVRELIKYGAKKIPTSGLVENLAQSAAHSIGNIPKAITEVTGIRNLYTTPAERSFENLKEDENAIPFQPKGFLSQVGYHGGNLGGFIVPIVGGAKVLQAAKLIKNASAANEAMTLITFYHDLYKANETKNPEGGLVNNLSAAIQSYAFVKLTPFLGKITKPLKQATPEIQTILKNLSTEKITANAAQEKITKTIVDKIKPYIDKGVRVGKQTLGSGVQMFTANMVSEAVSGVFTGKYNFDESFKQSLDAGISMLYGTPLLHMAQGKPHKETAGKLMYEMTEKPEETRAAIERLAEQDPEFKKIAPELLKNFDRSIEVRKLLDESELKQPEKEKYLVIDTEKKILEDKIKNSPSKALNIKDENKVAALEIEQKAVVDPDMGNQKIVEEFYNEELLPKGMMQMLEVEGKFSPQKTGEFLKFIAQQANGLSEDWKPLGDKKPSMENVPEFIIEKANERWAKEIEAAQPKAEPDLGFDPETNQATSPAEPSRISVIRPEENKPMDVVPLKKVENEKTVIEEPIQPNEQTGKPATESSQPETAATKPIQETGTTEGGEGENVRLTHADTEKIYEESGLPLRMETPTKHRAQLEKEADEILQKGYDFNKVAEETMSGGKKWEDTDQLLFARKVADLKSKQKNLDVLSSEFDLLQKDIEKYSRAADVAGTIGGRFLQSRKNYEPVEQTISDAIIIEKELTGTPELTDKQKEIVQKEYNDIQESEKAFAEKYQKLIDENNDLKAKLEIQSVGKTVKKGQKKDFKKEREQIFKSIKDKLAAARQDTSATIVPYAKELISIAPDVAKLVKSYMEQGVVELSDIIKKIHSDIGDEKIQERDIRDIIAGEYKEKKTTRNELAEKMFNLKREAQLVKQLEDLLNGEVPKSESRKRKVIKKIEDLKTQIKDIRTIDKDLAQQKESALEFAAQKQKEWAKDLTKAEKEIDTVEEKERKQKLAEAEKERIRLEKEFQKEKKAEEKAVLKAKVDEAKRIEKELSFRTPEERALDNYKQRANKQLSEIQEKMSKGDYSLPEKKQPIKLDQEAQELRDKLIALRRQQELRRMLIQRQNETGKQKGMRYAAEVLNIPRSLMTIADFSGLLRQNIFFSVGHPLRTSKALPGMFKSFVSQPVYDRWFAELKEDPRYGVMQKSNLAITDNLSHDLTKREEDFMSTLAEKTPILGSSLKIKGKTIIPGLNIVKGSERSYNMLLNKARVDNFNSLVDGMEARGMTYENSPKFYKAVAEYVNNATGRSDFGKTLNNVAPLLNSIFFSPRLIASRVNMLTYFMQPRFWKSLPREARIDYMKNWLKLLGTGATILALAKIGGAEVEDDPRSSDFGKIKSGNTRWDLWGGSQQYIRVLAQTVSGKRKSTNTGNIYSLDGDDIFGKTRADVGLDFFRGKLAPVPAAFVDLLSGRTTVGDKVLFQWGGAGDKEVSIDQYVKERLLPMTITGTEEAMKDQGAKALFTVLPANVFGVGTSTYKPKLVSELKIKDPDTFKERDATKEEIEKYNSELEKRVSELEKEYEKNQEDMWVDVNGKLHISKTGVSKSEAETFEDIFYSKLTTEQKKELKSKVKEKAAREVKRELFGDENE